MLTFKALDIWLGHHAQVEEKNYCIFRHILPNSLVPYPAIVKQSSKNTSCYGKRTPPECCFPSFTQKRFEFKLSVLQEDLCYIKRASETINLNCADASCAPIVQPGIDINSVQTSLYHFMPMCKCQRQLRTRLLKYPWRIHLYKDHHAHSCVSDSVIPPAWNANAFRDCMNLQGSKKNMKNNSKTTTVARQTEGMGFIYLFI